MSKESEKQEYLCEQALDCAIEDTIERALGDVIDSDPGDAPGASSRSREKETPIVKVACGEEAKSGLDNEGRHERKGCSDANRNR